MKLSHLGWLAVFILLAPSQGGAITNEECATMALSVATAVNGLDPMLEVLSKMPEMADIAPGLPPDLKRSALAMDAPRKNLINAIRQYKAALVAFGAQSLRCAAH